MRGYSGTNSESFLTCYQNGMFTKGNASYDHSDRIYVHTPFFSIACGKTLVLENHLSGSIALRRARDHGGLPMVFSFDYELAEREVRKQRRRSHSFVLNSGQVSVASVYLVRYAFKNACTVLQLCDVDTLRELTLARRHEYWGMPSISIANHMP